MPLHFNINGQKPNGFLPKTSFSPSRTVCLVLSGGPTLVLVAAVCCRRSHGGFAWVLHSGSYAEVPGLTITRREFCHDDAPNVRTAAIVASVIRKNRDLEEWELGQTSCWPLGQRAGLLGSCHFVADFFFLKNRDLEDWELGQTSCWPLGQLPPTRISEFCCILKIRYHRTC